MAISIKVGSAAEPEGDAAEETAQQDSVAVDFKLKIRRTMDNNIMISDHPDVDIVLMIASEKIVVYDVQNRLFRFLVRKGVVNPETVRAGNVYGSMEGVVLGSAEQDRFLPLVIMNISKFIEEERPYFEYIEKYKQMEDDELLDPDAADSTDLGEVPQAAEKGGIRPGYGRGSPYFLSYML